jgi:hypothetical protein
MNSKIVHGGFWRLRRGKQELSSESVEKKHAAELAKAAPDQKRAIYERILEESQRREKMANHKPSPETLW